MRTQQVKEVRTLNMFKTVNGKFYKYWIVFEDGEQGMYTSKSPAPEMDKFVEGQPATYSTQVIQKKSGEGSYLKIKPESAQGGYQGGGQRRNGGYKDVNQDSIHAQTALEQTVILIKAKAVEQIQTQESIDKLIGWLDEKTNLSGDRKEHSIHASKALKVAVYGVEHGLWNIHDLLSTANQYFGLLEIKAQANKPQAQESHDTFIPPEDDPLPFLNGEPEAMPPDVEQEMQGHNDDPVPF